MMKQKITIDSVAERAGVSKTTISRYLNGRYDMLSEDTRAKIEAAIKELHYRPNRIAQSLKGGQSRLIGCIASDIGSPFTSILVKGINSVATKKGYEVFLVDSEDDPEKEMRAFHNFQESRMDGIIINSTGVNDEKLLEYAEDIPTVFVDRPPSIKEKVDTVCTNNYSSTRECLRYLKQLGYKRIGLFTQPIGCNTARQLRRQGFTDSLREDFGLEGDDAVFSYTSSRECLEHLRYFVTHEPELRPAILAINGVALLDVLHAIKKTGIRIGKEFGVCGFDDWGWADLIDPGITTIAQDSWQEGVIAAEMILKRIEGGKDEPVVFRELKNRLEIRGSTVSQG